MPRLSLVPLACAGAFPAGAPASVTHDGSGGIIRVSDPPSHDTNICGLPGTFRMARTFEWHSTEGSGATC
jgi:hypothetical protein